MTIHFITPNDTLTVRRPTWSGNPRTASLATIFTNVSSSTQQDDVPIGLSGGGFVARTYTVFIDIARTIKPDDRLITADGKELRVMGVKLINSGSEDYQQISCEEADKNG